MLDCDAPARSLVSATILIPVTVMPASPSPSSVFLTAAAAAQLEKPAKLLVKRFAGTDSVVETLVDLLARDALPPGLVPAAQHAIASVDGPVRLATLEMGETFVVAGLAGMLASRGDAVTVSTIAPLLRHATALATSDEVWLPPGATAPDLRDLFLGVLDAASPGPKTVKLADELRKQLSKRRALGQAQAFLAQHLPALAKEATPVVQIWLDEGVPVPMMEGGAQKTTRLRLVIAPGRSPDWELAVSGRKGKKSLFVTAEGPVSDDFDLPILRRLSELSGWLAQVERALAITFSREHALVQVTGAKRPRAVDDAVQAFVVAGASVRVWPKALLSADEILALPADERRAWLDASTRHRNHAGLEGTRMRRAGKAREAVALFDEVVGYEDLDPLSLVDAVWMASAENNQLPPDPARNARYVRLVWPRMFFHDYIPGNLACLLLEIGDRERILVLLQILEDEAADEALREIREDDALAPLREDLRFTKWFGPVPKKKARRRWQ